jgi:uncharacterized protein (TIGR02466 family)
LVIGAGKASAAMATALESHAASHWPDAQLEGIVLTRYGHASPAKHITIVEAGHPVPDQAGMDGAAQMMRRVGELKTGDILIARNQVETLLRAGQHDQALHACETSLAQAPLDQGMLAMFTTALRLTGDPREASLADFHSIARVYAIDPPSGFSSMEAFNEALAVELRRLHTTRFHPTDQTLRGGTQTFGALFDREERLIRALREQLEKAIADYITRMPEDAHHPLFARRSRDFGFSGSWSVRLHGGGFHTNHFHPMGWISSAYYVKVPDEASDEEAKPGWFKLGETNLQLGARERVQRHVQPRPGHLVLFPSYFWHGTIPFNTSDERISVAFDVIPRG